VSVYSVEVRVIEVFSVRNLEGGAHGLMKVLFRFVLVDRVKL
jgi:hypothetical protein